MQLLPAAASGWSYHTTKMFQELDRVAGETQTQKKHIYEKMTVVCHCVSVCITYLYYCGVLAHTPRHRSDHRTHTFAGILVCNTIFRFDADA